MTEAYVDSGVNGAVRTFAGQDTATHVAARPEIIVYPKPADADRFRNYYRDLSTCLSDLYKSGLAAGSTVDVQRIPKRGDGVLAEGFRRADRRVHLDAQGSRRHPTGQDGDRGGHGAKPRRDRVWRSSCRPTRTQTSRPRLVGLQRGLGLALAQK